MIELAPYEWNDNIFTRLEKDWMLITAGSKDNCNTMTASYGGFGILFSKPVAHIYIRPHRHTYLFTEENDYFSLSFFNGEKFRKELTYCGRVSGKDVDKFNACGFTVNESDGIPYIGEADVIVFCKKVYSSDLDGGTFYDDTIQAKCYPDGDTHRMYIGQIIKIIKKDS